jgi:hypothetical protein
MKKAVVNVSTWSILVKISETRKYVLNMTGNPHFPNPEPSLADLTLGANELEAAQLAVASNGSKQDYAQLKIKSKALDTLLRRVGQYVSFIANGEANIISSSGMAVSKDAQPVGPMPKPTDFQVLNGEASGTMICSTKSVKGAKVYVVQATATPDIESSWVIKAVSTRSRNIAVNGLTSGTKYFFRCTLIGASEQGSWGDAVPRFAQ